MDIPTDHDDEISNESNSFHNDVLNHNIEVEDMDTTNPSLSITNEQYEKEKEVCFKQFDNWTPEDQIDFIEDLLLRMTHYQHGHINSFLKPMLQRDFISALPGFNINCIYINCIIY